MDAAWPAPDREESDGWVLRAASGVTQRANSVWPREPEGDMHRQHEALRAARLWYRGRRLPLIFQVFDDPRSTGLNAILDGEGFTRQIRNAGDVPEQRRAGGGPAEYGPTCCASNCGGPTRRRDFHRPQR